MVTTNILCVIKIKIIYNIFFLPVSTNQNHPSTAQNLPATLCHYCFSSLFVLKQLHLVCPLIWKQSSYDHIEPLVWESNIELQPLLKVTLLLQRMFHIKSLANNLTCMLVQSSLTSTGVDRNYDFHELFTGSTNSHLPSTECGTWHECVF